MLEGLIKTRLLLNYIFIYCSTSIIFIKNVSLIDFAMFRFVKIYGISTVVFIINPLFAFT